MEGLYTLVLRGEKQVHRLQGSEQLSLSSVSDIVSDLTGYRSDYLAQTIGPLNIGATMETHPAQAGGYGPPTFVITRVG